MAAGFFFYRPDQGSRLESLLYHSKTEPYPIAR